MMPTHPPDGAAVPADLPLAEGQDLWVFAYGSLMWNPGFPFAEQQPALLRGYHRRFCIVSHRYRGTVERPGLVLGLDRGGACRGLAYRVEAPHVPGTLRYLWDREMVTNAYRPRLKPVLLPGRTVAACCFIVDRRHPQYFPERDPTRTAAIIAAAVGDRGPNRDYLLNTVRHLALVGIRDRRLEALAAQVEALCPAAARAG